jgi:pectate lyase
VQPVADAGVAPPEDVPPATGCASGPAAQRVDVPSFPGAEGFGAVATGGRGGRVCVVSSLASSGANTLQACLSQSGARIVVFRVSGVIDGPLMITRGNLTLAGQTSPGGVIVRGGMFCENVYDPNDCNNVIVRHMRFRNSGDDNLRLSGANRVILDHVSLAGARDENLEVSRSQNITVQQSVIAEPIGDHYRYGGLLINYSKDRFPLANITLHHNVWNGVAGRLPEITCEENGDGPGVSNCSGHRLAIEVSNNVLFDVSDPVYYNRCTGTNQGNDCAASSRDFLLELNFIGNVMHRRATFPEGPMFAPEVSRNSANAVFWADDLAVSGGRAAPAALTLASRPARIGHPAVTITPAAQIQAQLQRTAGAFPRDPMDTRLAGYLGAAVESRPPSWSGGNGIDRGDGMRLGFTTPPAAPADRDNDGMPDAWETAHGLDPACPGAGLGTLAARPNNGVPGCVAGYTDLECYVNELAEQRLAGGP